MMPKENASRCSLDLDDSNGLGPSDVLSFESLYAQGLAKWQRGKGKGAGKRRRLSRLDRSDASVTTPPVPSGECGPRH